MNDDTARTCPFCGTDISDMRRDARVCRATACRGKSKTLPPRWAVVADKQCTIIEEGTRCSHTVMKRWEGEGLCSKHYARLRRHGDPYAVERVRRPSGAVQAVLQAAAAWESEECFLEPSPTKGRLSVSYQSRPMTAARAVYMLRHGVELTKAQFVLHTCHRGDEGCIAGNHLYLGDHAQNMRDMVAADRSTRGERKAGARLTSEDVREIRRRANHGEPQKLLAAEFGVAPSHVSNIVAGKTWAHVPLERVKHCATCRCAN